MTDPSTISPERLREDFTEENPRFFDLTFPCPLNRNRGLDWTGVFTVFTRDGNHE